MVDSTVRQATLDDTHAISELFRSRIDVWQRLDAGGRVETVPYEALTVYQRWLHGGPWMSVETAAIHLSRLLSGAGLPLVAQVKGQTLAYAEAYYGNEPLPFGEHFHLANLVVHPEYAERGLDDALLKALLERMKARKARHLLVSRVAGNTEAGTLNEPFALTPLARERRLSIPARTGQIFYRATEHLNPDPAQINGWYMPVGRTTSARQQWETVWHRTWEALPEIQSQRAHRLKVSAAGQDAFVCCKQQLYDPRGADVYCWSPKPLTNQLLSAIRDWAHREGYRTLSMVVPEDTVKTVGPDGEPDGYMQDVCAISLTEE